MLQLNFTNNRLSRRQQKSPSPAHPYPISTLYQNLLEREKGYGQAERALRYLVFSAPLESL